LRLEAPVLARVRDHLVIRSYSPVTTIGGGQVVEVAPRKRRRLHPGEDALLTARLLGGSSEAVLALLSMEGWNGIQRVHLPQRTSFSPSRIQDRLSVLIRDGDVLEVEERLFSKDIGEKGRKKLLSRLTAFHESNPLRPGMPLEELRQSLPGPSGPKVSDFLLRALVEEGRVAVERGSARAATFLPTLSERQLSLRKRLEKVLEEGGLAPPNLKELGQVTGDADEAESILRIMADEKKVLALDSELFFLRVTVEEAGRDVIHSLGGARDLGPADFRDVLQVTRKHLLPLLRYFDLVGVTTRRGEGRDVAEELPPDWGTNQGSK